MIPGEARFVETAFEIAVLQVEQRAFDPRIELAARSGIELAHGCIGEDGVIGLRIERAEQALVAFVLGAVISEGDEEAICDRTLGVDGHACLVAKIAVEIAGPAHAICHVPRTDGAFGQSDHGPVEVARGNPGFKLLLAGNLAIVETEGQLEGAAGHGRGELDQREAGIVLHRPASRGRALARQLADLLAGDLLGALIGSIEREFAGHAFAQRAIVAVQHADREHGARTAVRHQAGLFGHEFDPGGKIRKIHHAVRAGGDRAVGIDDFGRQDRLLVRQRNTAPAADREIARVGLANAVVGQRLYRLAVHEEAHGLVLAVPDGCSHGRRARIGIDGGGKPSVRAIAQRDPVHARLRLHGSFNAFFQAQCQVYRFRCVPASLRQRVFGNDGMEIGNHQRTALADREMRIDGTGAARGARAIDECPAFGQRHRAGLHDVGSGDHAIEVIAAFVIGDREAAVFQHHAHARDADAVFLQGAGSGGDAAGNGHAAGDDVALDFDRGAGARIAAEGVHRFGFVFRVTLRRIGAHRHGISDAALAARGNIAEREHEAAAIRADRQGCRVGHAIDPHGIGAGAEPGGGRVGHRNIALRAAEVWVAHRDGVEDCIARLGLAARGVLGDRNRNAGPVERNVDLHGGRIDELEGAAIRGIGNHERTAVRTAEQGDLRRRDGGWRGVGGRRLDPQDISAQRCQREPVFPCTQLVDVAGSIRDGLARNHGRGPRGYAVFRENTGGLPGDRVDQRDHCARYRFAGFAVEDHAEGIGKDRNICFQHDIVATRAAGADGDDVAIC